MLGGTIKKSFINSNLWSLTKKELLRRIQKYEKNNNMKSKISIKNRKDDMIKFIMNHIKQKKIVFTKKTEIIPIKKRTRKEKTERKKRLKEIKKTKQKYYLISKINYKEIPTLKEYIRIKLHNGNPNNKKKIKEPLRYIKFNTRQQVDNISFKLTKNKKTMEILVSYPKNGEKQIHEYSLNYDSNDIISKFETEYKMKVKIIKFFKKYYCKICKKCVDCEH